MSDNKKSASERNAGEVLNLLRARNALIWIVSPEEKRVEDALIGIASSAKYAVRLWDCSGGATDHKGDDVPIPLASGQRVQSRNLSDPAAALNAIRDAQERAVWVLRDFTAFLKDPFVARAMRNLARSLPMTERDRARAMIVVSPSSEIPPELADHAMVVRWELPDRAEIAAIFDFMIASQENEATTAAAQAVREQAIDAALGLSAEAAASCYCKSMISLGRIDPSLVAAEKKRVVNQAKGIEWYDPDPRGLEAIGGLDVLKKWLLDRKVGFTQEAREYGLPWPKGVFLAGVPGSGKSQTAKAAATAFGIPLLRLDLGSAQSKWVGESQQNIRGALQIANTVAPCVLWIDEVEKALAGATQGAADGGVSADALGTLLTWMQERPGGVFVMATANDITRLPPEFMRKGRWDELFFVDVPSLSERRAIAAVLLKKYNCLTDAVDLTGIAAATEGFTGAEIEALIPEAMYAAFADGKRPLATQDLVAAAKRTVPLSQTMKEKIDALREWAKTRARAASLPEATTASAAARGRKLDL